MPKPPTRPLRCAKCGGTDLSIAGAGNMRTVRKQKRRATHVRCRKLSCQHEWYSVHPEALRRGREADRAAKNNDAEHDGA